MHARQGLPAIHYSQREAASHTQTVWDMSSRVAAAARPDTWRRRPSTRTTRPSQAARVPKKTRRARQRSACCCLCLCIVAPWTSWIIVLFPSRGCLPDKTYLINLYLTLTLSLTRTPTHIRNPDPDLDPDHQADLNSNPNPTLTHPNPLQGQESELEQEDSSDIGLHAVSEVGLGPDFNVGGFAGSAFLRAAMSGSTEVRARLAAGMSLPCKDGRLDPRGWRTANFSVHIMWE